jgi:condensin complex subunit 2
MICEMNNNNRSLLTLFSYTHKYIKYSRFSATNAWAGSSHWKFGKRKAHGMQSSKSDVQTHEATLSAAPKSKARKGALVVDFLIKMDDETASSLAIPKLKKGSKSSTTELTAAAMAKTDKNSFILPQDAGVVPSDLGKLFLRPHKKSLRRRVMGHESSSSNGYQPTSNYFSAQNDDGVCDDSFGDDCGFAEQGDTHCDDGEKPFEAFNMDDDMNEARMLAPERKVTKISVHHEVRAKKVDVRELKHQIWNDISSLCPEENDFQGSSTDNTRESRQFSDVMESVAEKNNQQGVTLPFYFICILHLANEKGLKLEGCDDLSNFTISADQK